MEACPSTFALDDAEIHGSDGAVAVSRHLETCETCKSRSARRAIVANRFHAEVAGPLWNHINGGRRRRRWWILALPTPLLAAAAAILLARAESPSPYVGAKGAVAVQMLGRRWKSGVAFDADAPAFPGDEIQLTIRANGAKARYVLVGSVDGTGKFSPFYPATRHGQSMALPPSGQPLGPPIVLDDAPGPERILVALSSAPLDVRAVAPLAEAAAAAGDTPRLPGVDATFRWVILQKQTSRGGP